MSCKFLNIFRRKTLTEAELLLLDFLIYGVEEDTFEHKNLTVKTLTEKVLLETELGAKPKHPTFTSAEEWQKICHLILKNKRLTRYQLANFHNKNDMFAFTARYRNDIVVIFRGTVNAAGWDDNAISTYSADSPDQRICLRYLNNLPKSLGRNLVLSGHSKGGNRAQYLAILSPRVKKVVAFDSQGFSQEFSNKYALLIRKNAKKITNISAANDFVHGFLNQLPGTTQRYIKTPKFKNFFFYHKANILLDELGNLRHETPENGKDSLYFIKFSRNVEKLDLEKRKKVVESLTLAIKASFKNTSTPFDMRGFVASIPVILKTLPKPTIPKPTNIIKKSL
jgi:hypothetical protein